MITAFPAGEEIKHPKIVPLSIKKKEKLLNLTNGKVRNPYRNIKLTLRKDDFFFQSKHFLFFSDSSKFRLKKKRKEKKKRCYA